MKLSEYYKTTVVLNDSGGGWNGTYYGCFSKIINDNNYKVVAEVGIGYGTHAKYILNTTNVEKLILIDPTKYYPDDGFATDIMKQTPEVPGNNFNELYELINSYLSPWKDRYTWFRTESLNITDDQVSDKSLDCIFIDGDHRYESVKKDLIFWWSKLRAGGQLLGDDYWMSGVAQAVHEFAHEMNLQVDFLYKDNSSTYKIYRFNKL